MKFKVGDKVRQVSPHFPYSNTGEGFFFEGAVGEVVRVTHDEDIYPVTVRFPDEVHHDTWPYKTEELELVPHKHSYALRGLLHGYYLMWRCTDCGSPFYLPAWGLAKVATDPTFHLREIRNSNANPPLWFEVAKRGR